MWTQSTSSKATGSTAFALTFLFPPGAKCPEFSSSSPLGLIAQPFPGASPGTLLVLLLIHTYTVLYLFPLRLLSDRTNFC